MIQQGPPLALPPVKHAPAAPAGQTTTNGLTLLPTSLASQGASLLPTSLAGGGAKLYSPSIAASLAGTQYNQAIKDAQQNLAMTQAGATQALSNVGNWWDAIVNGQQQATQRDAALTQSVSSAEAGNNASVLASLGGSADPAASSVASAGQNAQGTLAAIGAINGQYNNDMSPILQMGAAGAKGQQQTANQANISQAMQSVQDQISAKGATQAQDQYQILQANNQIRDTQQQRLIDIMQGNNTIKDNRVTQLTNIVNSNNNTLATAAGLTETQKTDAQNYSLQLRGLNDTEEENKLGALLAVGYDPSSGGLTPQAAQAIAGITGIDPKALTGTSASGAASIIGNQNSNATRLMIQGNKDEAAAVKSGQVDTSQSRLHGFFVDHNGKPILSSDGAYQPIQGYHLNKAGDSVKDAKTTSSTGSLTENEAGTTVSKWLTGTKTTTQVKEPNPDSNGNAVYKTVDSTTGQLTYQQMLEKAHGYTNPRTRAMLISQINHSVIEGDHGRPFTGMNAEAHIKEQAAAAIKHGWTAQHLITALDKSGLFPPGLPAQLVPGLFFSPAMSPLPHTKYPDVKADTTGQNPPAKNTPSAPFIPNGRAVVPTQPPIVGYGR